MVKRAPLRATTTGKSSKKQRKEDSSVGEKGSGEESQSSSEEKESKSEDEDEEDQGKKSKDPSLDHFIFEFSDFNDSFQDGVQLLLKELVRSPFSWAVTEALAEQGEVGTLVHCEGETDVFAIASIIAMSELEKLEETEKLTKSLRNILNYTNFSSKSSWSGGDIGWFIHNRFSNLPPQLHAELHKNLIEDLNWVNSQNIKQKGAEFDVDIVKAFQKMKRFVYLAPCTPEHETLEQLGSKDYTVLSDPDKVQFTHPEDEFFFLQSEDNVLVKLDQAAFSIPHAVAMIIERKSYDKIVLDIANNAVN